MKIKNNNLNTTRHFCILLPAHFWYNICTNFLELCRKLTFFYYLGQIQHLNLKKYIWDALS